MRASAIAQLLVARIEAVVPSTMAGDSDRFYGSGADSPEALQDRAFAVVVSAPRRDSDRLDPTAWIAQGIVLVAYRESPELQERLLDDCEDLVDALNGVPGSIGAEDILDLQDQEASLQPGEETGTVVLNIPFSVRYRR